MSERALKYVFGSAFVLGALSIFGIVQTGHGYDAAKVTTNQIAEGNGISEKCIGEVRKGMGLKRELMLQNAPDCSQVTNAQWEVQAPSLESENAISRIHGLSPLPTDLLIMALAVSGGLMIARRTPEEV